jgi:plasmid maintenance system antidote protein VapI
MRVFEQLYATLVERNGLTVTEAAERLKIARPNLSNVVNGNAALSIELALKVEREFGVDARRLLIAQLDENIAEARDAMPKTDFTGQPTAELKLWVDLRRAADQMALAQWRSAHPSASEMIPEHADLVIWLLDQLADRRKIERVDAALAKRVGDHINRDAKLRVFLTDWLAAYSLDIFPEPDIKKARELLGAGGMTVDAISATMGRHVLKRVIEFTDSDMEDDDDFEPPTVGNEVV